MRVLLIKTSSMGDIIHTLPALTDAGLAVQNIEFDWVIEEPFAAIPKWHPLVNRVIPVALRRWRKVILARETREEWQQLRKKLNETQYDLILDAQGLIKSAFLTFFTKGLRVGLDFHSARESFASFAYQRKCKVNFYQHAVVRMRSLFSQALGYPLRDAPPQFGLSVQRKVTENYLVFLHGTTWVTKQWPEEYWTQLANMAGREGYRIKITGGNQEEMERANRLAASSSHIDVLPYLNITDMGKLLQHAKAAVSVDTGFGHLAAALDIPTVSLYGSTNAEFTGALGKFSKHLSADFPCAPCLHRTCTYRQESAVKPACFTTIKPERVWQELRALFSETSTL